MGMNKFIVCVFISFSVFSTVSIAQELMTKSESSLADSNKVLMDNRMVVPCSAGYYQVSTVAKNTSIEHEAYRAINDNTSPTDQKYYRVILKQEGNRVFVQDFYVTGEKRTDPYIVIHNHTLQEGDFDQVNYEQLGVDGYFSLWFITGQLEQRGLFSHNAREGLWVTWYSNGQRRDSGRYKHGLKEGQWTTWYQNGKRMQKGAYKEGKRESVWIFWYGNGTKREAGRYSEGQKVERWNYWDEAGKIIKSKVMDNDNEQ